jgi:hypothetical protein
LGASEILTGFFIFNKFLAFNAILMIEEEQI